MYGHQWSNVLEQFHGLISYVDFTLCCFKTQEVEHIGKFELCVSEETINGSILQDCSC